MTAQSKIAKDFLRDVGENRYSTVLADPPWQFQNKTGKVAPEHKRLSRSTRCFLKGFA